MRKKMMMVLLSGWLATSGSQERSLWAVASPPPVAGPSAAQEQQLAAPAPLGLLGIFASKGKPRTPLLAPGSRFRNAEVGTSPRQSKVSSRRSVRLLLRDHFLHNLRDGVAILDRTLVEWGQRRGTRLQLSRAEQIELQSRVDDALIPVLRSYHSHELGRNILDTTLSLAQARGRVYQQLFRYLAEGTKNEEIRHFMRSSFEPISEAGAFLPQAAVRADFLSLWVEQFERQAAQASAPASVAPESWKELLGVYQRDIVRAEAGPALPQPADERAKYGVEAFLTLLGGWAPPPQALEPADRLVLQKLAVMPFPVPEAQQRFWQDLLTITARGRQLQSYQGASTWPLGDMPAVLATLRQGSDFLRATSAPAPSPVVSAEELTHPPGLALAPHSSLQQLFRPETLVAQLGRHLDTTTFAGLLGAQTLQRLEHGTAVMEATLAALGVLPQLSQPDRLERLTQLLCEGYRQYHALGTTEPKLLSHLRLLEEAYWKEVGRSYPEGARQGKFTSAFHPSAEATPTFLREFSKQAREKVMPALTLAETHLLQQILPTLQTKEGVAEVVHLLLARGAGYQSLELPAWEEVRRQMQEYELHPTWVSKRSAAIGHILQELAVLYRTHPGAPVLGQVKLLLQPLLDVGFGLEAPAPASGEQPGASESFEAPMSREAGAGSEASSSSRHEVERQASAEAASSPQSMESHPRNAEGQG